MGMVARRNWFSALGLVGAILVGVGSWIGWRDFCDRQGVTIELSGATGLHLTTNVEQTASFTLRNNTFRVAKLVGGAPG